MKFSRDGKYVGATGVYKPVLKVYELDQLSMKFERHLVRIGKQYVVCSCSVCSLSQCLLACDQCGVLPELVVLVCFYCLVYVSSC